MPKNLFKSSVIFLSLAFLIFLGVGCKTPSKEVQEASKPLTLTVWSVFDDYDGFSDIISSYRKIHPNITIDFRKLRYDEYETELLEALAEDRGPDIISLHNTWLGKHQSKLLPMPAQKKLAFQEVQGTVKKEMVWVVKTMPSLGLRGLRNNFIDQVYKDVVWRTDDAKPVDAIYGLPLSVDTLVMYYNKDLLN
ncbi:MAG: extracellular solute-binding protein, partial [Patescibacteria group bacterium]